MSQFQRPDFFLTKSLAQIVQQIAQSAQAQRNAECAMKVSFYMAMSALLPARLERKKLKANACRAQS